MRISPDFSLIKYEQLQHNRYVVMCETKNQKDKFFITYISSGNEEMLNPFWSKDLGEAEKKYDHFVQISNLLKM